VKDTETATSGGNREFGEKSGNDRNGSVIGATLCREKLQGND